MADRKKLIGYQLITTFFVCICFVCIGLAAVFGREGFTAVISAPYGISDCGISATTWFDANSNGTKEADEEPLQGVCLWVNDQNPDLVVDIHDRPVCSDGRDHTDRNGYWTSDFFSCSSEIYVSAKSPAGFKSTTIPIVLLNNEDISFGFTSESTNVPNEIKDLEFYASYYRNMQDEKVNKNRILAIGYLSLSAVFSWLIARKLVKSK
jgi:hypothetical protein